jgi:hypothetical protein
MARIAPATSSSGRKLERTRNAAVRARTKAVTILIDGAVGAAGHLIVNDLRGSARPGFIF